MSRKDYIALAEVIKRVFDDCSVYTEARDLKPELLKQLCIFLKSDNCRFKEEQFIEACGGNNV